MKDKIGFIGNGNMARAMIAGLVDSGDYLPQDILLSAINREKMEETREDYGLTLMASNSSLAERADIIILAVKPKVYGQVLEEIRGSLKDQSIVISIAPGKSIGDMEGFLTSESKLVKAMPNTPVLVKEGMTALSFNDACKLEDRERILKIFTSFGRARIVEEDAMDAVTALSGSSPAYVYVFIEALADAGVLEGMKREDAYDFAGQAVLGAAKMVLETGLHPASLKDQVTSPGGTTIEALAKLEEKAFRASIISAARACAEKSRAMSKS